MIAGEKGSAAVLALLLVAALASVALVAVVAGGVLVGHRRAASAADLSALAGAEALGRHRASGVGGTEACRAAASVAEANAARVTRCVVEGREVLVAVEVPVRGLLGGSWSAPGRARAGPAARTTTGGRSP